MEVKLDNGNSIIKIKKNEVRYFIKIVDELIEKFGGEEIKRSSRFVYYRINKDILNGKGAM